MSRRVFGCALTAAAVWLVPGRTPSRSSCCPETSLGPTPATSLDALPRVSPSPPASEPTAGPRPVGCALLTPTQVDLALGVGPSTPAADDEGRICRFSGLDGAVVLVVRVVELPRALLGGPEQVTRLTASPSDTTERIPELADSAVYCTGAERGTGLAFARGRGERITSGDITAVGAGARVSRNSMVALGFHAEAALPPRVP